MADASQIAEIRERLRVLEANRAVMHWDADDDVAWRTLVSTIDNDISALRRQILELPQPSSRRPARED